MNRFPSVGWCSYEACDTREFSELATGERQTAAPEKRREQGVAVQKANGFVERVAMFFREGMEARAMGSWTGREPGEVHGSPSPERGPSGWGLETGLPGGAFGE